MRRSVVASTDTEIRKQRTTVSGTDDDIPHQTMLKFGHVASRRWATRTIDGVAVLAPTFQPGRHGESRHIVRLGRAAARLPMRYLPGVAKTNRAMKAMLMK